MLRFPNKCPIVSVAYGKKRGVDTDFTLSLTSPIEGEEKEGV
jgi:hypothetical protein